jgi:hypothetical protein
MLTSPCLTLTDHQSQDKFELKNRNVFGVKIRKEMEKTKPVSGTMISTLSDADDFELLSGARKSLKDGFRHCAVPPINR